MSEGRNHSGLQGHVALRAAFDAMGIPEVRALAQAGDTNRRKATDTLVGRWHRANDLRHGLGQKKAAEAMWLLSSVEQYLLASDVLGWSGDAYEQWLCQLLDHVLLASADT